MKFPDYLTYEEASTLPCAGLTAWNALVVRGQLQAGETIVIQGTGGVALFALQLAKTIGARVILLSSDDEKLEKAGQMGADELINYHKNPNWEELVIDRVFRFDQVKEAYAFMQSARHFGKIVIDLKST